MIERQEHYSTTDAWAGYPDVSPWTAFLHAFSAVPSGTFCKRANQRSVHPLCCPDAAEIVSLLPITGYGLTYLATFAVTFLLYG
jgi:hypothetical protein